MTSGRKGAKERGKVHNRTGAQVRERERERESHAYHVKDDSFAEECHFLSKGPMLAIKVNEKAGAENNKSLNNMLKKLQNGPRIFNPKNLETNEFLDAIGAERDEI